EVGMLIAYLAWSFSTSFGTGSVGVVVAAIVAGITLGLLIERLVMRPMLGEPVFSTVLVTIGLAVVLRSLVQLIWGASPHKFDVTGADAMLRFDDVGLRISHLGVIAVLIMALVGIWYFFKRSRFGVAMRAVAADEKTARLMGV